MTRRRKISLAASLLALAGLAAGFYAFYVVGPDLALQRAEAFRFRRMTVAKLADQGVYRFHYVTNRVPVDAAGPVEGRFASERGETLHFGSFDTYIEPTLGLGMLVDATAWFRDEEIRLERVAELDQAAFVARMRELVGATASRSLLLVVHGFRERFPSALRKTAFVGHVLDINTPVVVFDWPGDQGSSLRGYRQARSIAEASGAELARTIELLIREVQPQRLGLLANSMGAQVVADAFGILGEIPDLADAETEITNVVLTAPDVDHAEFDARFEREIRSLTDQLTVYVSSNDRALLASRLINRGLRLGESTASPDQLNEALGFAEMVEAGSDRVALVDVTPVNRTRNFHNFSLETPEFFDDLYLRLTNSRAPRSRLMYAVQGPDGRVYWVLTRGR